MTSHFLVSMVVYVIVSFMIEGCFSYEWDALPDNCTCARKGHPTYSLFTMPRRRIIYDDGQYTYTFFPCEPDNLISAKGSCKNVALCKYDTTGSPHVYRDIGEQRDVKCEATSDYPFELKYTITSGAFKGGTSTVIIKCSKDPSAKLVPINITTTIMKFKLETPCGCPNQCLPESPTTAKPGPTPAPPNWEVDILSPIVGFFAFVGIFLFIWWLWFNRLLRCPRRHDYDNLGGGAGRDRLATENTPLIDDREQSDHAIEHEDPGAEGNLTEPVQVEEGDVKEEDKFVTPGIRPAPV